MDEDDPPSEYGGIAAQFGKAKALKRRKDASEHQKNVDSPEKINKRKELQFKASHGLLLVFFTWLFCLHALGIYFFAKGFLLTKLVLDYKSDCAVPPIDLTGGYTPGSSSDGCWHPKTFEKAIVIIVDALRYDFTVPFHPNNQEKLPHYFHNALHILYELAAQQPDNAFLLPFIADPPTTTLQRLKGLTTGTLPTFIDAGSNFAGTAIEEDNLLAQLRNAGQNLVHLGDDTWHSLFPGYFDTNLTHAYDSFNVWDLHTVDDGVTEHLLPLLHPSNTTKWDIIFGHYLGVDHAGHRYGPDHPAMTAKLQQMDRIFRQVVDVLDDQTLLVVMGDHGMDAKGDHGGESDDEVEAALWMYSKKGIFGRSSSERVEPPRTAKERPVGQIDLVPTLSLLLGVPIPFNNLGAPIEEAFVGNRANNRENLATVNRLTGAQIKRYQHEYALARGLDESITSVPLAMWEKAERQWRRAPESKKSSADHWKIVSAAFSEYQQITLSICRSLWARFDVSSMVIGIEMLLAGVVLLAVYARGLRDDRAQLTPLLLRRLAIGTSIGVLAGVMLGLVITSMSVLDACLYGSAAGGIFGVVSASLTVPKYLLAPWPSSLWGWLAFIFTVSQSIGFASNSYTIWEDEILLFFIVTFGVATLISSFRQVEFADRTLGIYQSFLFVLLTRLASLSRLCREEQMPLCRSTYYASATSSTSAPWQLLIPFALAILLPDVIKSYYKGTRSYEGSGIFWVGFAFRIGLLLTAVFWTLDSADDGDWFTFNKDIMKTGRVVIAQLVLAVAFAAGTTTFAWAKPCVSIQTTQKLDDQPNGLVTGNATGSGSSVTILGYANVHGSRYFLLVSNWLLAIILVQKPMGGGAIGILSWQILSLLEIIDTNNLSQSAIGPVVLGLLGSFHFFKTGHQATLSSI
ncbi:MAG: mannose-ethanolamine phosphotransferase gpi13, partial [Pleopsidium flavum]